MNHDSRFIVGIDLGTTNCALTYVDTAVPEGERGVSIFHIPQLVARGEVKALPLLPSFLYLPEQHEIDPAVLSLPWAEGGRDYAVGAYARDLAGKVPGKIVSSAKSWLCVDGLDKRAATLPWDRRPVPRQVSPVDASRLFLEHLRDAWNYSMAGDDPSLRLEQQDVSLTVPASFDAVARELTAEAAAQAGLGVRLLEEPQAAFYAWLHDRGDAWRDYVSEGDVILVCDIGGGTTDFTLITVTAADGRLGLERVAVGDHILLGGDNMDLTLAYGMAAKIEREQGKQLDGYQLAGLAHACRAAKERLERRSEEGVQKLTVLGRGTGVVGGAISVEISTSEMRELLVDGFFPLCAIDEQAEERRKVGLRSFGLDYASDPATTKHLASFIVRHGGHNADGRPVLPNAVLFNGGVMKSEVLRQRVVDVLGQWREDTSVDMSVLTEPDADLGVAVGSAWYGNVQRIGGVRIKSGSSRSYYIGVESSMPAVPGFAPSVEALCVVPFGMEEGSSVDVPAEGLGLVVGEQTEFRFFSSTVRTDDAAGSVLESWRGDELEEMPPLMAELPAEECGGSPIGSLVPVALEAVLTEVGTLQLWCHDVRGEGRWKLEFELRG